MIVAVSFFAFEVSAQTDTARQTPTQEAGTEKGGQTNSSIGDLVKTTSDVSTLGSAVRAAGMEETLNGDGPYTVFAPSNDAFTKLPNGKAQSLMQPDSKEN